MGPKLSLPLQSFDNIKSPIVNHNFHTPTWARLLIYNQHQLAFHISGQGSFQSI
jgi:hypothetical protein